MPDSQAQHRRVTSPMGERCGVTLRRSSALVFLEVGHGSEGRRSRQLRAVSRRLVAARLPARDGRRGGAGRVRGRRPGAAGGLRRRGRRLTADDFVFPYDLLHGSMYDSGAIAAPGYTDLAPSLDSVTALDRYTVLFKAKVAYAPFLTNIVAGYPPLPKHVLDPIARGTPAEFKNAAFNLAPSVVSGPFTLSH